MTWLIELLVFSRRSRTLPVLCTIGALGWLAIYKLSLALAVVLVVVGLAAIGMLIAWMTDRLPRIP